MSTKTLLCELRHETVCQKRTLFGENAPTVIKASVVKPMLDRLENAGDAAFQSAVKAERKLLDERAMYLGIGDFHADSMRHYDALLLLDALDRLEALAS